MIGTGGHVGSRVSALVDGQLPAAVADKLWAHVHGCCLCREQVEREGWIKSRLAGLCRSEHEAPSYLASMLATGECLVGQPDPLDELEGPRRRGSVTVAVVGAGSVSAALLGVLALAGPLTSSDRPADRRGPVSSIPYRSPEPVRAQTPTRRPAPVLSPSASVSLGPFINQ